MKAHFVMGEVSDRPISSTFRRTETTLQEHEGFISSQVSAYVIEHYASFPRQLTAGVSFHAKNGFSLMKVACCCAEKALKLIKVG